LRRNNGQRSDDKIYVFVYGREIVKNNKQFGGL
jgi:hypothetical protein